MSFGIIVDTDENVVFLDNAYISHFPRLRERLTEMAPECNGLYNVCGAYGSECPKSYTIMGFVDAWPIHVAMSETHRGSVAERIDKHAKGVKGYLVAVVNEPLQFMELYDLCVFPSVRRKGVAKSLLRSVVKNVTYPIIWLAIDFQHRQWDVVLKLYAEAGFQYPAISSITPSGLNLRKHVLGLVFDKSAPAADPKETIQEANRLRVLVLEAECTLRFIMSSKLALYLRAYVLDERVEVGGPLFVSSYTDGVAILALDKDAVIKGSRDAPTPTVVVPHSTISFHTHPSASYKKDFKRYIGWPSGADMVYVIDGYLVDRTPMYTHFVVTDEGVYFIGLTEAFQRVLLYLASRGLVGCVTTILEAVMIKFGEVHVGESIADNPELKDSLSAPDNVDLLYYDAARKEVLKNAYVQLANSYTLSQVIEEAEGLEECPQEIMGADFPLFRVQLANWPLFEGGSPAWGEARYIGKCDIEPTLIPASRLVQ